MPRCSYRLSARDLAYTRLVIHRWGWTVVLNLDGTTTGWNKDKTKVLHGHGPSARPG